MISYKKIDILQLSIGEEYELTHKSVQAEIKSPIMLFSLSEDEDFILLNINRDSEIHNLFLNLNGYIDRLFKIKNIETYLYDIDNGSIMVYVGKDITYKLFDSDSKNINKEKLKNGGKAICSYETVNGIHNLKQLLFVK